MDPKQLDQVIGSLHQMLSAERAKQKPNTSKDAASQTESGSSATGTTAGITPTSTTDATKPVNPLGAIVQWCKHCNRLLHHCICRRLLDAMD